MLDVVYEAATDLAPGRLAKIEEERGTIRVRLDKTESLPNIVRQLNIEVDELLAAINWFQLWKDEVVCHDSPGRGLRVVYRLNCLVPETAVILEDKGLVEVHVDPGLDDVEHFAAAMNAATKDFLAGGQWFQLYEGEVIDNSPERNTV